MENQLIQERKLCTNCGMNALFTNVSIDLTYYGTRTYEDHLHCENCGEAN